MKPVHLFKNGEWMSPSAQNVMLNQTSGDWEVIFKDN
jgi:hypothetical protein